MSIIIPSLNSVDTLKKNILSIENQLFKNLEVLVVDGGSTDDTLVYLQTLNKPFSWVSETDLGIYDAMNKGIEMAKGEWVYFLGSDDKLLDNSTLQQIFIKEIEQEFLVIIGQIKYDVTTNDSFFIKKNKGVFLPSWSSKLWIKNTTPHQGVFYRRDIFENLRYNTTYNVLADYDLNLQLFKSKIKVKIVDKVIAICGVKGISKKYNWSLYLEEVELKTKQSYLVLKPVFYLLAFTKYMLKKIV